MTLCALETRAEIWRTSSARINVGRDPDVARLVTFWPPLCGCLNQFDDGLMPSELPLVRVLYSLATLTSFSKLNLTPGRSDLVSP